MNIPGMAIAAFLAVAAAAALSPAHGQAQPRLGQEGKDVVWVPSADDLIETALDMANVGRNDFFIDLGSGDGRVVVAAARRGARALGIEYDAQLVDYSRQMASRLGVSERAQFMRGDLFQTDFSQATVLYLYLLPGLNAKLMPAILQQMKPGTRVLAAQFGIGHWRPQKVVEVGGRKMSLWIVPSRAEAAAILAGRGGIAQAPSTASPSSSGGAKGFSPAPGMPGVDVVHELGGGLMGAGR